MSRAGLTLFLFLAVGLWTGCAHRGGRPIERGAVLEARDDAGNPVTLRIDGVERAADDRDGDLFYYEVSYQDPRDGMWKPFCQADAEGRARAVPLQGVWNASGDYVPDERLITFACTKGVLGKCVRWGYKPWQTVNGVSLRDYHQACTRMARADYCGNGRAHTRDGTLINMYDRLDIQTRDDSLELAFEAAWGPDGATYLAKPRYGLEIAPIVAECPDKFQGRTSQQHPNLTRAEIERRWPETLLFNESGVKDEAP